MPTSEAGLPIVEGVVGVIQRGREYLIIRRAPGVRVPGTWCFPGGAIEPGETQEVALVREMQEELRLACRALEPCWEWEREDGRLRLYLWRTEMTDGPIRMNLAEVSDHKWATRAEILGMPDLLPSMIAFFEEVDTE